MRSREQELVDIVFQVGLVTKQNYNGYFDTLNREQYMEWVAKQLRDCGFDTVPRGLSWGELK